MSTDEFWLPPRREPGPTVTTGDTPTGFDQIASVEFQNRLRDHALGLPGVRPGLIQDAVPEAVAFYLDEPVEDALLPDFFGGKWGHIHPRYDSNLLLNVPAELAKRLVDSGWAEYHPHVELGQVPPLVVMLYAPRDEDELAVCSLIVEEAYLAHGGARHDSDGRPLGLAAGGPDRPS